MRDKYLQKKAFAQRIRNIYPNGSPRVKTGSRINTIHGPGTVAGEYECHKTFHPYVVHDTTPTDIWGRPYSFSQLAYYSPFEYEPEPPESLCSQSFPHIFLIDLSHIIANLLI